MAAAATTAGAPVVTVSGRLTAEWVHEGRHGPRLGPGDLTTTAARAAPSRSGDTPKAGPGRRLRSRGADPAEIRGQPACVDPAARAGDGQRGDDPAPGADDRCRDAVQTELTFLVVEGDPLTTDRVEFSGQHHRVGDRVCRESAQRYAECSVSRVGVVGEQGLPDGRAVRRQPPADAGGGRYRTVAVQLGEVDHRSEEH